MASRNGFSMVEILIVLAIIGTIAAIAIPNLIEMREGANETSAIGSLRTLHQAQTIFKENDVDRDGQRTYAPDLTTLRAVPMIDEVVSSGTKSGYAIAMGGSGTTYTATAAPLDASQGARYFFIDQSGVIRFQPGAPAGASSPPVD